MGLFDRIFKSLMIKDTEKLTNSIEWENLVEQINASRIKLNNFELKHSWKNFHSRIFRLSHLVKPQYLNPTERVFQAIIYYNKKIHTVISSHKILLNNEKLFHNKKYRTKIFETSSFIDEDLYELMKNLEHDWPLLLDDDSFLEIIKIDFEFIQKINLEIASHMLFDLQSELMHHSNLTHDKFLKWQMSHPLNEDKVLSSFEAKEILSIERYLYFTSEKTKNRIDEIKKQNQKTTGYQGMNCLWCYQRIQPSNFQGQFCSLKCQHEFNTN